jgi:TetR/AcrR family transcriptional regulator, transcriptional repressor of aconitase
VPRLSEADKDARRERILEAARRCFAEHGYEGATVARLERESGLSRGAIFNWFDSKEELFFQLAVRDNDRLIGVYVDTGFDGIVRALVEEDPAWLAVYVEFGRRLRTDPQFRERWKKRTPKEREDAALRRIEEAQAAGELRDDVAPEELGRFFGVVLDGITVQRALGFDPPDTDLVLRLVGDATRGRRPRSRRRHGPAAS